MYSNLHANCTMCCKNIGEKMDPLRRQNARGMKYVCKVLYWKEKNQLECKLNRMLNDKSCPPPTTLCTMQLHTSTDLTFLKVTSTDKHSLKATSTDKHSLKATSTDKHSLKTTSTDKHSLKNPSTDKHSLKTTSTDKHSLKTTSTNKHSLKDHKYRQTCLS